MRFLKYINEDETPEIFQQGTDAYNNMIQSLKRDCRQTLGIIEAPGKLLYRGINWKSDFPNGRDFFKKTVRKDRKPLTTNLLVHQILDRVFEKVWGWKVRSQGLFASCDIHDASYYGGGERKYYCFPCDKWEYLWSSIIGDSINLSPSTYNINGVKTFTDSIKVKYLGADHNHPENNIDKFNRQWEKDISKVVKEIYHNDDINAYFKRKNTEIMIKCDDYYMINVKDSNIFQILEDCKK